MSDARALGAAERAKAAGVRTKELEERLQRLRSGEAVTADDVRRAEQAAEREQQRNMEAHRLASDAHRRAAQGHLEAAQALEAAGHADRAAEHRRLAGLDDEAARAGSQAMNEPQG